MSLVTVKPRKKNLPAIASTIEQAKEYASASKASATRKAYGADLRDFGAWCAARDETAFPATPQTVALYFTDLASTNSVPKHPRKKASKKTSEMVPASISTIRRRMVAIAQAHKAAGHPNPVADPHVRDILKGIANTKGTAQRKKAALTGDLLRDALLAIDAGGITPTLMGLRNRAILLLTFATAARRSEIAALNVEDLRFEKKNGLVVTIRKSKTDQEGEGREIGVPFVANEGLCAVHAVKAWIDSAKIKSGALFRTFSLAGYGHEQKLTKNRIAGNDVARLVKRVTGKASIGGDFSGHSLRAGFITTAASTKGVREVDIARVSGHRSEKILRGYVRRANVFTDAPLAAIFGNSGE